MRCSCNEGMVWKGDTSIMSQLFVYVTEQLEFIHKYENAPQEVSYLRNLHRHILHIKVKIEVFNEDREIEFIMLKHRVHDLMQIQYEETCSCESIAVYLLNCMKEAYGTDRDVIIEVSEDGENGVVLENRREKNA